MPLSQETNIPREITEMTANAVEGAGRGDVRQQSTVTPAKARRVKKRKAGPYGLAALLNNCMVKDKRISLLKDGFVSIESVVDDYRKMRSRVEGKRGPLMVNDKGEVMTFPVRSRWNTEWCYGGHVGRKMLEQLQGLKKVTHFILTTDPTRVSEYMPDWWCYGEREFLTVVIGFMVSEFFTQAQTA